MNNIPTEEDWSEYDSGRIEYLDLKYAHDIFSGKSNKEMFKLYKGKVLMRAEDIYWMPIKPFQYYIFSFRDYVIQKDFGLHESSDAASAFLRLILNKLKEHPSFVIPVLPMLMDDIEYIANNQAAYEADVGIYGNFIEILAEIKELINNA